MGKSYAMAPKVGSMQLMLNLTASQTKKAQQHAKPPNPKNNTKVPAKAQDNFCTTHLPQCQPMRQNCTSSGMGPQLLGLASCNFSAKVLIR
jgi:hypothetical protein